jgi:hypothetical protein
MSKEIMNSELLVELSEQEQELVAGGFGPRKFGPGRPPIGPGFGRPPVGPGVGRPPIGPGSIGGDFGGHTPFGDDEGFDGFPFNESDE